MPSKTIDQNSKNIKNIYVPSIDQYVNLGLYCEQIQRDIKTLICTDSKNSEISSSEKAKIFNVLNNYPESILSYYMPIVNNKTGIIEKYEALVRLKVWNKIIFPWLFLPLIENTPSEPKIIKKILEESIKKLEENPLIKISINVSWNDLENKSLFLNLKKRFKNSNIAEWRLCIEILETVWTKHNTVELWETVKLFKECWISVLIDDLGSKNSNINRLLSLKNADMVKIDWWIIQWLSTKTNEWESNEEKEIRIQKAHEVITFIVQIANNQWQKVIAEYVSDKQIFEAVKRLWIDYSQWYYIWKADKDLIDINSFKNRVQLWK